MAGESSNGFHEYSDEMSLYKKDSNAVVTFNIVYEEKDLTNAVSSFKPLMSHQIFGVNESIFGYRSITIDLFYLHNSAQCYVNVYSSGKLKRDVYKPDNIMESLNPWLPENFTTNKDEFVNWISKEKHNVIYGNILHEYAGNTKLNLENNVEVPCKYKITKCDLEDANFKAFHSRFETLVIWHIDGANFIDLDDEKWEIFYVYEECECPKKKKLYVTPIGYCTAYKFFAYPQNIRSRISQFFILPTHQKRGIGTVLYQTIFKEFQQNSLVIDITVEEPTSSFQKIRDIHDCGLAKKSLQEKNINLLGSPLKKVFEILKGLKLGRKQCQRVYDILMGCESTTSKLQYNQFLRNLNKRIENEVKEKLKGMKKMKVADGEATSVLIDQNNLVEAEFKKYKEDLDMAISYVRRSCQF